MVNGSEPAYPQKSIFMDWPQAPKFAAWAEGEPLDMDTMLWDADGNARAAVVSLGHLEEAERHFSITLILSRLISWMRSQSGTGELRVLVYIDEVMGLAPPNGNPSPKKPILTPVSYTHLTLPTIYSV